MSQLNGYSLEYAAPPSQPAIGITYSTGSVSRSGSATSSSPLKRKRSEAAMTVTAVTVAAIPSDVPLTPIILPDIYSDPDEPYEAPPSPVPTEIVDDTPEKTAEEHVEAAKAVGVKVRDFAHEPVPKTPRDPRAPEMWTRALENLIQYDRYIRRHPTEGESMRLPGKVLCNLLALGWITHEEAERNWREGDWKAVGDYMSRPNGPYPVCIPKSHKRPTAAYRAALRMEAFRSLDDDVPEECIYVPPDEPGMDDGPQRISSFAQRFAHLPLSTVASVSQAPATPCATQASATQSSATQVSATQSSATQSPATSHRDASGNDVHADKRRRVSSSGTPPAGPSRTLSRTLSRSASSQLLGSSRSGTPVYEEPPAPRARTRGVNRNVRQLCISSTQVSTHHNQRLFACCTVISYFVDVSLCAHTSIVYIGRRLPLLSPSVALTYFLRLLLLPPTSRTHLQPSSIPDRSTSRCYPISCLTSLFPAQIFVSSTAHTRTRAPAVE
ncbi:hypothetical protein OH76DRAFT_137129 [Lentinus brumalis]|uniref:Uncharacterized protein n=1 Tax=Lentinus brumalis TaxID=2498619 RepID=A0A371CPX8_9APHY|nr:hypothetical protein OH76DRAFT_137129 [Polyporus brumalis]